MSESNTPEARGLLNDASPLPGSASGTSFAARHRPGYQRVASVSVSFEDSPYTRDITDHPADEIEPAPQGAGRNHGLGISSATAAANNRLPQRDSPTTIQSPGNGTPMYSPAPTSALSGSTRFDDSFDSSYKNQRMYRESRASLQSATAPSIAKSDAGLLSIRSRYDDFAPHQHTCQSRRAIKHGRFSNWISLGILVLAVFSTVFSAAFVIIALKGPKYGRRIRKGGDLTPSEAAFLTSLFAKLIELSFVTIVVAFVGQALARRAFKLERARGVTLAEMSMRSWVMQPGVMFTQWESVKYAGLSILGVISLLAALMAILYTSAATALVQPQLVTPGFENRVLQGLVKSSFANPKYISGNCKTPVPLSDDPDYAANTCLQIEHNAMAFVNYRNYLETWSEMSLEDGNSTIDLAARPKGYALLNDNTTITAPWISLTETQPFDGYIIDNVTMAMPHVGVVQAAIDPINALVQPYEVDGASYNIRASVPSPMVNVLCATLTETQVKPFIYEQWENRNRTACNETTWLEYPFCASYPNGTDSLLGLNETDPKLLEIFRWGPEYGSLRNPPMFPKLPKAFNTLINTTRGAVPSWGRPTVYVLGAAPTAPGAANGIVGNYSLCQLQAGQTPLCMTRYDATSNGGEMEAVCETDDPLRYDRSELLAPSGNATISNEFPNIFSEWMSSLSLNAGQFDGNASNARLLTQFIMAPNNTGLVSRSLKNPSMAEALAVMAGNTLIMASQDAPFVMFWNYSSPTIEGRHQSFNASVRTTQYASGGSQAYQKPFHVVLIVVFLMNLIILAYFIYHRDWYTDFSEPMNLFSLAVNSPPSEVLAGSCGCGPTGDQYKAAWKMNRDGNHYFVASQEQPPEGTMNVDSSRMSRMGGRRWTETFEMVGSPVTAMKRFSARL